MSPIVSALQPLPPCSWIVVEPIVSVPPPQSTGSSRPIVPPSSAAPAATILNVEPGSYASVSGRHLRASASDSPNRFGSNGGHDASARTAPVAGSRTIAEAPFGWTSAATRCELALGRVLDRGAQREAEGRSLDAFGGGLAAGPRAHRVRALRRVLQERDRDGPAAHLRVVPVLEAAEAVVVRPDVAEDGRGERPLGVAARRLGHERDARQPLLGRERADRSATTFGTRRATHTNSLSEASFRARSFAAGPSA